MISYCDAIDCLSNGLTHKYIIKHGIAIGKNRKAADDVEVKVIRLNQFKNVPIGSIA